MDDAHYPGLQLIHCAPSMVLSEWRALLRAAAVLPVSKEAMTFLATVEIPTPSSSIHSSSIHKVAM
eukprot:1156344-Pelagomonas_calceolata.AAC.3